MSSDGDAASADAAATEHDGVNNQHQTGVQQLGMGILDNNNQQQGHGGEEGKTGGD